MDIPSSTPVFRASIDRNRRSRGNARKLDLFLEAHMSDPGFIVFQDTRGHCRVLDFKLLPVEN
jgi:hypothetical protein